jgi:anti-anti-sigma factor
MEIQKVKDVVILKMTEDDLADPVSTQRLIENMLKNDGEKKFVVDLSAVQSIYSLQIGTLVTMHVLCYENVAIMKLSGVNEKVRNILRIVGLETLMEMHHGTDVALESFGKRRDGPQGPQMEGPWAKRKK